MQTRFLETGRHAVTASLFSTLLLALLLASCRKNDGGHNNTGPSSFNAEVLDKWMTLQLRLLRNATGTPNHAFSRHFAYAGVAALESLAPGINGIEKWTSKFNGLSGLPAADQSNRYYYPANVNAAMASINKAFFPNGNETDKAAIDSLEAALNESFLAQAPQGLIDFSAGYGKAVAAAVFNWAETDGYKNSNAAYTPPAGPGLWVATPPAFANAITPYWGNNRTIFIGSIENTQPPAPPAYSTDPKSAFYQMVKQVYDVSLTLTDEQKAMALFWRDVPGATTPGHWLSIVQQVVRQTASSLERAALAYAVVGGAGYDALISCWQTKYHYNLLRPVTYIRDVLGFSSWTSFITTPAHPEYSSAHGVYSGAESEALYRLYGNIGSFTDHTYDYLGFAPMTFPSLRSIGENAAQSRLYAGIHYQQTIDASLIQARKVVANIFRHDYAQ